MARAIYSDESDTSDKGRSPIFTVAAVVVEIDRQSPKINEKAREILGMLPPRRRDRFEFKAAKMFPHVRKFGDLSKFRVPMVEFLEMMRLYRLPIRSCAVNRSGFAKAVKKGGPQDFAFLLTAADIEKWFAGCHRTEGGLWFADPSRKDLAFADILDQVRKYGIQRMGLAPFKHFPDTVAHMDSKRSVGIQMADFANFFLRLHLLQDKVAEPFFDIIKPFYGPDFEKVWYAE
jgi:hypothetical protein